MRLIRWWREFRQLRAHRKLIRQLEIQTEQVAAHYANYVTAAKVLNLISVKQTLLQVALRHQNNEETIILRAQIRALNEVLDGKD